MNKFEKELSGLLGTGFTPQQKQGLYKALAHVLATAIVVAQSEAVPEHFDVFVELEDEEKADV